MFHKDGSCKVKPWHFYVLWYSLGLFGALWLSALRPEMLKELPEIGVCVLFGPFAFIMAVCVSLSSQFAWLGSALLACFLALRHFIFGV